MPQELTTAELIAAVPGVRHSLVQSLQRSGRLVPSRKTSRGDWVWPVEATLILRDIFEARQRLAVAMSGKSTRPVAS